jgi:dTDP-4-amino-4,6-dideoxygalactose transaminase
MIPPHRPAFGLGAVITAALSPSTPDLLRWEAIHAKACGVEEAVWLPSGRAGICWALRATIKPDTRIIGPAFTCTVVHEAMVRAGGQPVFIDAAPNSFHMDMSALNAARSAEHALVLSEPYGHSYELGTPDDPACVRPSIRIVDSAMAVPTAALFRRLRGNDFAVVSFGGGKNSFAGWGAVGLTRDTALAAEVRRLRDYDITRAGRRLVWRRGLSIALRTAAQRPAIFSGTRKLWYWGRALRSHPASPSPASAMATAGFPSSWKDDQARGPEWYLPATRTDLQLAMRNLTTNEANEATRLKLAARYREDLSQTRGIQLPPASVFALSHYTILVPGGRRDEVKARLLQRGVYAVNLWAFDGALDPARYPRAHKLSSEVLNLPLSQWMSVADVDRICEQLTSCLN